MTYHVLLAIGGAFLVLFAPVIVRDGDPRKIQRIRMNGLMLAAIGVMFALSA